MLYAGVQNVFRNINLNLISIFEEKLLEIKKTSSLFYPILKALELNFFSQIAIDFLI